jgi:hypothetical protein
MFMAVITYDGYDDRYRSLRDKRIYVHELDKNGQKDEINRQRNRVYHIEADVFSYMVAFCLENEVFIAQVILRDVYNAAYDQYYHVMREVREEKEEGHER